MAGRPSPAATPDKPSRPGWRLLGYLRATLRRLAVREHARRNLREAHELPSGLEAQAEPGYRLDPELEAVTAVFLQELLGQLSARERQVVIGTVLEGRTEVEVARELGVSQQRVSALRRRAFQKLRRFLEEVHRP